MSIIKDRRENIVRIKKNRKENVLSTKRRWKRGGGSMEKND